MVADIEFLTIYAEICLGTVAFMAIVATLRQTFGESLTAYQYLITRFLLMLDWCWCLYQFLA